MQRSQIHFTTLMVLAVPESRYEQYADSGWHVLFVCAMNTQLATVATV